MSRASLNQLSKKIGCFDLIDYQHDQSGGFKSIGGDAFEATVGAMYIDKGYKFVRCVLIDRILRVHLDVDSMATMDWNFKSKLIDWGQKNHKKITFGVVRTIGSGHAARRQYESQVCVDGEAQQSAIDFSIKAAEQLAAEKTYKDLVSKGVIKK